MRVGQVRGLGEEASTGLVRVVRLPALVPPERAGPVAAAATVLPVPWREVPGRKPAQAPARTADTRTHASSPRRQRSTQRRPRQRSGSRPSHIGTLLHRVSAGLLTPVRCIRATCRTCPTHGELPRACSVPWCCMAPPRCSEVVNERRERGLPRSPSRLSRHSCCPSRSRCPSLISDRLRVGARRSRYRMDPSAAHPNSLR